MSLHKFQIFNVGANPSLKNVFLLYIWYTNDDIHIVNSNTIVAETSSMLHNIRYHDFQGENHSITYNFNF